MIFNNRRSAIVSGLANNVSDPTGNSAYSFIGGGARNQVKSHGSTIGGGFDNTVAGEQSFVGGGTFNKARGNRAVIAGGKRNVAEGPHATISGGFMNTAEGRLVSFGCASVALSMFVLLCH